MFKIKDTVKTANKAKEQILKDKDLLNNLIYAAATVITEDVKEQDVTNHKLGVQKHSPGLDSYRRE